MAHWQYTPFTLPLILACIIALAVLVYGLQRRHIRGGAAFALLMASISIWLICNTLEISRADVAGKIWWTKASYVGIVLAPLAWLLFTLTYTGREAWLTRRRLLLLSLHPLIVILLTSTNELHHLHWTTLDVNVSVQPPVWNTTYGPAFWLHTAYSYALMLTGAIVLLLAWRRAQHIFRQQISLVLVGAAIPWVTNAFFILGIVEIPYVDPTALSFLASSLVAAWAIYGFGLIDVTPIARRTIIDSMADSVIAVNTENRIVDLNPRAGQLLGLPVGQLLGQDLTTIVDFWPELIRALPAIGVRELQVEKGPPNSRQFFEARRLPLHSASQELVGQLYVLREVTEQVRMQDAYQSLVNQSLQGLALVQDNLVVFVNQALADIVGAELATLHDLTLADLIELFHPDDREQIQGRLEQLQEPGMVARFESRLNNEGDGPRWVEQYASVILYGERPAIQVAFIDITERKSNEAALRAAQQAAVAANRAKSEFLANMTHEIRTPINAIMGMSELLMLTPQNAEQVHYTRNIVQSSEHLRDLVDNILDFSKIEAGKLSLKQQVFALKPCLDEAVSQVRSGFDKKHLTYQQTVAPAVPEYVFSDPIRLRQILVNLLSNAVKFTQDGVIELQVEQQQSRPDKPRLQFAVRDEGVGISAAKLPQLFQAFYQIDSSATRAFGGTGLGLSICKELVSLLGGEIWVESKVNQGSTFYFTIPLLPLPQAPAKPVPPFQTSVEAVDASLRVLIVEDDEINRTVAVQALTQLGYRPDVATNGLLAVAQAEQKQYDIILMDIQMPVMDGVEATRRILKQAGAIRPWIIALTASTTAAELERCRQAGINAIIAKPYHLSELADALSQVRN